MVKKKNMVHLEYDLGDMLPKSPTAAADMDLVIQVALIYKVCL